VKSLDTFPYNRKAWEEISLYLRKIRLVAMPWIGMGGMRR
jgi:hypothetical protein